LSCLCHTCEPWLCISAGRPVRYCALMYSVLTLTVTLALLTVSPESGPQAPFKPAGTPSGWAEAREKDSALGLDSRHKERIALLEGWIKRYPAFPDAHARLGAAYESVGRDLIATRVAANVEEGRKYLELAATHFKRALDLGGDENRDITIRAMAELLAEQPFGLSRPAERDAFVREMVKRYPQEARSHVELMRVLLEAGKLDEADKAFTAARTVVDRTADARAELAEGTWPDLRTLPENPAQVRLFAHALAVVDEALKMDPRHFSASSQKEDILRAQAARSKDPARAKALLLEAERLREQRMRRLP
jgi:tetratricopeptide (TPR) repeat protein